ncbi:MFS transporter [Streptomyces sp. ISL-22]|uniref:MFS transporter n=1 Tax=unclassified Streptomyces TaxID=2593676 RepID=UPI001BE86975|nr:MULTISPECIES: MFS transporter [unclassified Streptomyces]MBT2423889.1 MFS transporter [Streptomyces sp. ISL-24]MBT2437525.1 MFS transporter [Streptomyces sp. ISL-22]
MEQSTPAPTQRKGFREALGLPDLTGNRRFLTANIIDSLGNGLVLAFTVVFFVKTTSLPLVEIGAALTLGRLLCLPVPVLVGPLLDRFGSRAVVAIGNVVSCVGFLGCLFSSQAWHIVIAQLLVQTGSNVYWTCSRDLVVLAAKDGERTRWFGLIGSLRNIGGGFGAAAAAIALAVADTAGLRGVVLGSSLAFLVASWLIASWKPAGSDAAAVGGKSVGRSAQDRPSGGYLDVLKDGAYMRLVAANLSFVFAAMVLPVLLAVYVTEALDTGAWIAGALVVLNMILVALVNTVVTRWTENRRPARVLALAAVTNAVAFAIFGALAVLPSWAVVAGLILATLVYTVAEVVGTPPSNVLSVSLAQEHIRGRYLAAFQLSWTIGGALAPVVLTALLDVGPAWPWVFLAVASVLAVPLSLGLREPSAEPEPEPAPAN